MIVPIEPIIEAILKKYVGCTITDEICEMILEELHNGLKFELEINLVEDEEENNEEKPIVS